MRIELMCVQIVSHDLNIHTPAAQRIHLNKQHETEELSEGSREEIVRNSAGTQHGADTIMLHSKDNVSRMLCSGFVPDTLWALF